MKVRLSDEAREAIERLASAEDSLARIADALERLAARAEPPSGGARRR